MYNEVWTLKCTVNTLIRIGGSWRSWSYLTASTPPKLKKKIWIYLLEIFAVLCNMCTHATHHTVQGLRKSTFLSAKFFNFCFCICYLLYLHLSILVFVFIPFLYFYRNISCRYLHKDQQVIIGLHCLLGSCIVFLSAIIISGQFFRVITNKSFHKIIISGQFFRFITSLHKIIISGQFFRVITNKSLHMLTIGNFQAKNCPSVTKHNVLKENIH